MDARECVGETHIIYVPGRKILLIINGISWVRGRGQAIFWKRPYQMMRGAGPPERAAKFVARLITDQVDM